jgi:hypothetical protein
VAAFVVATAVGSAWKLHQQADEIDDVSERRSGQLERLVELSHATALADRGALSVAGVFDGHEVVVARAPWGTHLALRLEADRGER